MKNNVLLIDVSFSSKPIYDILVSYGFNVFVIGSGFNNYLAKICENHFDIDYSDPNKLLNIIEDNNIDFVVPGCNDKSYEICSILNEKYFFSNLDSVSVNQTINDKSKFREFSEKHNINIPKTLSIDEVSKNLPVIIKPSDSFSGKGNTVLFNTENGSVSKAIEKAKSFSSSNKYLIEQYIDGQLYSHSAFIVNKKIAKDFIVLEYGSVNEFVVDTSYVVEDFAPSLLGKIQFDIEKIAKILNLSDGLVHTQFMIKNDKFYLIEMTRRCPGDLYSQLIEMSTGFNYVENYLKPFILKDIELDINRRLEHRNIIRHTITLQKKQNVHSIFFTESLNIINFVPLISTGSWVSPSPVGRIGIIFFELDSIESLKDKYLKTINGEVYSIC